MTISGQPLLDSPTSDLCVPNPNSLVTAKVPVGIDGGNWRCGSESTHHFLGPRSDWVSWSSLDQSAEANHLTHEIRGGETEG